MKNNIDFNQLNFMKNQLRNYVDLLARMKTYLDTIVEYNLILTEKEIHELTQIFYDIDIFTGSLKHFNQNLEKFNNKIQERIEE